MPFRDITLLNDNATRQYGSIGGAAPALSQAGDKLLICAVQNTTNTFTITSSGPTVPVLRSGPDTLSTNETAYLWSLTMAAGDVGATYTISAGSGGWFVGAIVAFSNASSAAPVLPAAPTKDSNVTSTTAPTITTTADNSDVCSIWVARAASGTVPVLTTPSGHTKAGAANTSDSSSPNLSVTATYRTAPGAAGPYGGVTGTYNESVTGAITYTVGLAPNATTGDPGFDVYAVNADGSLTQYSAYYVDASGALQQVADKTK